MAKILYCPRCKGTLVQKFYGPCQGCRDELRVMATQQSHFRRFLDGLWPGKMDPSEDD